MSNPIDKSEHLVPAHRSCDQPVLTKSVDDSEGSKDKCPITKPATTPSEGSAEMDTMAVGLPFPVHRTTARIPCYVLFQACSEITRGERTDKMKTVAR